MNTGYYDEAKAWRDWLLRAAAGSPGISKSCTGPPANDGCRARAPWLGGYENSKPVRIGNAAVDQLQLDVFGEVMDALHHARRGTPGPRGRVEFRSRCSNIWKRSGAPRRRHLGGAERTPAFHPFEGDGVGGVRPRIKAWRRSGSWARSTDGGGLARTSMKRSAGGRSIRILARSPSIRQRSVGCERAADPQVGFCRPTIRVSEYYRGHRAQAPTRWIRAPIRLGRDPGRAAAGEGASFLQLLACRRLCPDWRLADARRLFERLTALCNDVGLLAEEYDPSAQRLVAISAAFSHIALVNTAHNIAT